MTPARLPEGLTLMRTTDVFTATTVPGALLREHKVADDVWGRLLVHSGSLTFVFEDDPEHPVRLEAGSSIVIPPGRLHHVEPAADATFAVEFHR